MRWILIFVGAVILQSCKNSVRARMANFQFLENIEPILREKIDSFLNKHTDYHLISLFINRTGRHANLIAIPTNNSQYLNKKSLPLNYEFYKGRLFLIYTGEEIITNRQYDQSSLFQAWDSVCRAHKIMNTDDQTYCPSFLAYSVEEGSGKIESLREDLLNAFFERINIADFIPPLISDSTN